MLTGIAETVKEYIFPSSIYCICCGNIIDYSRTYSLCDHCMRHIRWEGGPGVTVDNLVTYSCAEYGIYERSIIFALKYDGHRYISRQIAEIMRDRLIAGGFFNNADAGGFMVEGKSPEKHPAEEGEGLIIPVPIHKNRERERGFNQSALIARYLGRLTGIKTLERGLIRTRETLPMRGLGPVERRANIRGSIEINKGYDDCIKGKEVLLVDDFFTTGSTACQCRDVLMCAGARKVTLIAFASRRPDDII